jgi:hypothetical protein
MGLILGLIIITCWFGGSMVKKMFITLLAATYAVLFMYPYMILKALYSLGLKLFQSFKHSSYYRSFN